MTEAIMLAPKGGLRIDGGGIHATMKAAMSDSAYASTLEVVVPPGYDVGAHVHSRAAEMFYVVAGQLDVLGFEPDETSMADLRRRYDTEQITPIHPG